MYIIFESCIITIIFLLVVLYKQVAKKSKWDMDSDEQKLGMLVVLCGTDLP